VPHPSHDAVGLSPRELTILRLVALGRTTKEIASALGISQRTVNWHLGEAFMKLGASSRAEAVALAMEARVIVAPHSSAGRRAAG
jgi:DNA-binding CsgD family transcriptional regulator